MILPLSTQELPMAINVTPNSRGPGDTAQTASFSRSLLWPPQGLCFPPLSRRQRGRSGRVLCPTRRPFAARGMAAAPRALPGPARGRQRWGSRSDPGSLRPSTGTSRQRAAGRRRDLYALAEGYRCLARRRPTEAVLRHLRQHFVKERLIGMNKGY